MVDRTPYERNMPRRGGTLKRRNASPTTVTAAPIKRIAPLIAQTPAPEEAESPSDLETKPRSLVQWSNEDGLLAENPMDLDALRALVEEAETFPGDSQVRCWSTDSGIPTTLSVIRSPHRFPPAGEADQRGGRFQ